MDSICAMLLSPLGNLDALFQRIALLGEIVEGPRQRGIIVFNDAELNAQEEFTADLLPDSVYYIEEKFSSSGERLSVNIFTVIYSGTYELIKQVAVRGMQFDTVKASINYTRRSTRKVLNCLLNVSRIHSLAWQSVKGVWFSCGAKRT